MMFFPPGIGLTGIYGSDADDDAPIGSVTLKIEQEIDPLFFSATWTIRARIGERIVARSSEYDKPLANGYVQQWARAFIRTNKNKLKQLGVDVVCEYKAFGGAERDL